MSYQSQNQNFYVVPIPQNITVLQSFKKWRRTGENLNGAIMIGVLEHFLINGQLEKIQQMLNNVKSVSDDQVKKMRICIEKSLQFPKGEQKLDFIMDFLKQSDPHNIFAEKFILEYVKRVKGNIKSDDELLKTLKSLFSVSISIIGDDNQNNLNVILDPKEREIIYIYNYNSKYYVIQKEAGPQLYKCVYCAKQFSEDYYKMNCSQIICYQCLKKFFDKGNKLVQCREKNCSSTITQFEYEKIMNKKKENEKTEQLNQIIQQKAEERQQFYPLFCHKCKNRMSQEALLSTQGCSHNFCKDCLIICFSVIPSGNYYCIIQGCKGKFIQKDFDQFTKGVNSKQNSQIKQNRLNNLTLQITPQENQELNNQCEGCFNYFSLSSIYTAECSHKFCQICCDKEIKQNVSCFQCYKVNCGYKLKIEDIQKFYYKKIKSLTFGDCANCKQECKIFESFQNRCQHLICYSCVKQIYTERFQPICKLCQTLINPNDLDDYYLPQASKEIQQIQQMEPIEYSFEQLSCTFCNSPFTNYNLQQDIPCQIHQLGSCCIIFPSDCPQCQISSLIIEKQRLRFVLFQNEMDNFYFTSEILFSQQSHIIIFHQLCLRSIKFILIKKHENFKKIFFFYLIQENFFICFINFFDPKRKRDYKLFLKFIYFLNLCLKFIKLLNQKTNKNVQKKISNQRQQLDYKLIKLKNIYTINLFLNNKKGLERVEVFLVLYQDQSMPPLAQSLYSDKSTQHLQNQILLNFVILTH
ncbi:unnamed protein product [Paramecium sonneborni]|uniref:RING-type domain-containing protein n=1 Tax=Paramecium sonneborni TaxID=65129 RepID=A0A8S1QL71_9CILI|nr:unnamed protein product [Paramecium sonneborni]